jgi:DNA-binding MarR family transcriptional regulator
MTNRMDKLEAEGLVRPLPDPNERRGKLVEMTPEGRDRLDGYINIRRSANASCSATSPPRTRRS